jgi:pimeloyl-ACP methyl ester carboxylesterase
MDCTITARRAALVVAGIDLSYLDWGGSGPAVVLLHGITSSAATLWRIGADLAATGYRVVVPDMPGHGESAVSPAHDIDAIAHVIDGFIAALDLQQITLIGHSWGGATALALAGGDHAARERLARVCLLDPLLSMDPAWGGERLPAFVADLGRPAAELQPQLRAANPEWHACDVFWKADALERCRYAQVEGLFLHGGVWRVLDRAGAVPVPLLVLIADPQYSILPAELQAELRHQLRPGLGRAEIIPGTTHNMLRGPGYAPTMAALRAWIQ